VGEHGGPLLRQEGSDVNPVCDVAPMGVKVGEARRSEIWRLRRKPSNEAKRSSQSDPVDGHLQNKRRASKVGRPLSDAMHLHVIAVPIATDRIVNRQHIGMFVFEHTAESPRRLFDRDDRKRVHVIYL
jgi:hypothetical protein